MTHTPETVRGLVIGANLAAQVRAMRQQQIGARALRAYMAASRA